MSTRPVELLVVPAGSPSAAPHERPDRGQRDRLIARANALSWVSLGWMTVEGPVAITAAIAAGAVALLGFGADSAIEAVASVIVIWGLAAAAARPSRPSSARSSWSRSASSYWRPTSPRTRSER